MQAVAFGKKWKIETQKDFVQALVTLDENEFIANMSDDYSCTKREMAEIEHQRADVMRQAREKEWAKWMKIPLL